MYIIPPDLTNTYIKDLVLDFTDISIDEYDIAFDIVEQYLDKCVILHIINCDPYFYTTYFYEILQRASQIRQLIVRPLYVDIDNTKQVPPNLDYFSAVKFENLKEICLKLSHDAITRKSYLSSILGVFSKNDSLKSNLESFKFVEWIYDSNEHVYDILKTKSFGYLKCKVYEHHATEEYVELYEPKITKQD